MPYGIKFSRTPKLELMKILHVSAAKNWGGGENHILNLCKDLDSAEHLVLCLKNSEAHKRLPKNDIQVFAAPLLVKFDFRYVWKLISICKKEKIDLVHIHDTTALTLAVMATSLSNVLPPYILSKKTSFPIKDRKQTLFKYNHLQIKKILCVSNVTKKVTAESIEDKSKLITVYHGTKVPKTHEAPFLVRERFNIPKDKILIGTIANHIRAKNLDTWVEVVDHIVNTLGLKNYYFLEIGNTTERTEVYEQQIKEKNLEDYCKFTGFLPEASSLIPQFDISLMTSQSEGVPQFIYESFYYKVPVVSTNVGGIPEIIEDGKNGMLSDPHDGITLGDKLVILSNDPEMQINFTEISYKKLIGNYTTQKMAANTLAQYKEVLYG